MRRVGQRFSKDEWARYPPKAIALDPFVDEWSPKMKESGASPAVFPVATGASVVVTWDELQADLRDEMAKY